MHIAIIHCDKVDVFGAFGMYGEGWLEFMLRISMRRPNLTSCTPLVAIYLTKKILIGNFESKLDAPHLVHSFLNRVHYTDASIAFEVYEFL